MTGTKQIPLASYEDQENPMTAYLVKDEKGCTELIFPATETFKTAVFYLTGDGYRIAGATEEYVKMLKGEAKSTRGIKITPVQMDKEHYVNYQFVGHNIGGLTGDVPAYILALLQEGRKATEQEISSRRLFEQNTETTILESNIISTNTIVESIVYYSRKGFKSNYNKLTIILLSSFAGSLKLG